MTKAKVKRVLEEEPEEPQSGFDSLRDAMRGMLGAAYDEAEPKVVKTLCLEPDRVVLLLQGDLPPDEEGAEPEVVYCLRCFRYEAGEGCDVMQISLTKAEMIDLLITMTKELGLQAVEVVKPGTIDNQNV